MTLYGPNNKQLNLIVAEISEKPNTLEQNLSILKNWLAYQPHLPRPIDDQILSVFLRGCKHNVERTKKKIDSYYTGRASVPELFSNRDPCNSDIQNGARVLNIYALPQLTPDGSRITVHRFRPFDPSQLNVQDVFKYLFMLADVRIMEETAFSGDIYLFDLQDVLLTHCVKLASPLLRKTLVLAQEAYPQRLKEIHVFNAPPFVDWILNIFKSLMKEKMRNRFYVHAGHETLYQYVPRQDLPKEYGGNGKSAKEYYEEWLKKLESYQDWFKKQESMKADERQRPNKESGLCTSRQMFGYEGAFRTLDID